MQIERIHIADLKPYEKNAKTHPKKQIDLLAKNIERFGFTTPVLVDKHNSVIAGHGRLLALKQLGKTDVPCVRMDRLTEKEVKALRLADNKISEMGEWDMDLVVEELKDLDNDVIDLTGFDDALDLDEDDTYTSKIETPVYEANNEKPKIHTLVDKSKEKKLLENIEKANVSEEEKNFLRLAASRHNIFDYSKIADFYAHSSKEMQELMEQSALVIIDFQQAIENGFVELSEKIKEQYKKDVAV